MLNKHNLWKVANIECVVYFERCRSKSGRHSAIDRYRSRDEQWAATPHVGREFSTVEESTELCLEDVLQWSSWWLRQRQQTA